MKLLQHLIVFPAFLVLAACGGGGGGSSSGATSGAVSNDIASNASSSAQASTSSVASLNEPEFQDLDNSGEGFGFLAGQVVRETLFTSAITGVEYPVHIYLPPGYDDSQRRYPVIYALDGQTLFPGLPYLLEDEGVEAILVAIAEGPDDRRRTDYLLPGARDYFQFIVHELIPFAEAGLRVDTSQRTIAGTSFGGVFAGLALLMDDSVDPVFHNFFAFDASFYQHPEQTEQLEQNRYLASAQLNAKVFLSSALPEGNDEFVTLFEASLAERNFNGLTVYRDRFQSTHGKITEPSFRRAIGQLWGNDAN
ncbi:alpha/beta hydrolase [Gilvimarinus sp. DA14]|uniref:alpha/beta hydrolase n=1 Tax=Gilvimarinus sp. DA14 TaxID=2956798 RepID=UPI0020B766C3|nr:alpha/beta hydrolase-fold protein [Gilvimarinus sp. DA14]UTF59899.1 alpha/beta hydrolase-fold protein [Gilvimarinus sp. DA14]